MRIKFILFMVTAYSLISVAFGQETNTTSSSLSPYAYNKYRLPSINAGAGIMTFFGDIGTYDCKVTQVGKFNNALAFGLEQRLAGGLALTLNGVKGSLCEVDNRATRHQNFRSEIMQGSIGLNYHLDNGYIIHKYSRFSPYLSAGFGYMTFVAKGDLRDKNDHKYFYWPDGTIRDQNFDWENPQTGNVIQRDYSFETELDTLGQYTHNTFVIPVGGGVNFKFSDKIEANISSVYCFTKTDAIDNLSYQKTNEFKFFNKHNDGYLFTNVTLQFNIGGKSWTRLDNMAYKEVNFRKLFKADTDGDKVKDKDDKCPDTPTGVKVDKNGCPIDTDKDGVPDYLDKEPQTPLGVVVDENGVALTVQRIQDDFVRDSLIMNGEMGLDRQYTMSKSDVADSVIQQKTKDYYNSIEQNRSLNQGVNVGQLVSMTANNNLPTYNNTTTTTATATTTTAIESGMSYKVQIGTGIDANSKDYFEKKFNITDEISIDQHQGLYKYTIGSFSSYADARAYANEFNARTNANSFVVTYKDGVRYAAGQKPVQPTVQPEVQPQKQEVQPQQQEVQPQKQEVQPTVDTARTSVVTPPEVKTTETKVTAPIDGYTYRIQIGAGDANAKEYYQKKYNITDEIFVEQAQGVYKYSTGNFFTYEDARAFANKFNEKTQANSFVVTYKDGVRAGQKQTQPQPEVQPQTQPEPQPQKQPEVQPQTQPEQPQTQVQPAAVDTTQAIAVTPIEVKTTENKVTAPIDGYTYRIQIGAGDANAKEYYQKKYNITDEIFVEQAQGVYKYSTGNFFTYEDARAFANKFNEKTQANSFVVTYKDGVRAGQKLTQPQTQPEIQPQTQPEPQPQVQPQTPATDTAKVNTVAPTEPSTNDVTSSIDGVIYRIQIGSVPDEGSRGYYQKKYNITEDIFVDHYQGVYKYTIGTLYTFAAAEAYLAGMKEKHGINGFIIAIKDGNRITLEEARKITGK